MAEICPGTLNYSSGGFNWTPNGLRMAEIHPNILGNCSSTIAGPQAALGWVKYFPAPSVSTVRAFIGP